MAMERGRIPQPLKAELGRTPLIRKLASSLDVRLITVIAPSGYGKTTLVAQYCRNSGRKTCWVDLSENDLDARRLESRLSELLEPVLGKSLESSIAPERRSVAVALLELARDLNRQSENIDLVFDNTDVLTGETASAIGGFVEALAEGHRVFLLGHTAEHLRIARLVARGETLDLTSRELSFAQEETNLYLQSREFEGNAELVQQSLDGWPAGVALTASGARLGLQPRQLIFDLLSQLSPEVQGALPLIGPLRYLNQARAERLGVTLGLGWIEALRRIGLPVTPLGSGNYLLHDVFAEALSSLLAQNPERFKTQHRLAAALALEDKDDISALLHLTRVEDWEAVLELAIPISHQGLARRDHQLVRTALEGIPTEQLPERQRAALARTWLSSHEAAKAQALLDLLRSSESQDAFVMATLALAEGRKGNTVGQLELSDRGLGYATTNSEIWELLRLKANALLILERYDEAAALAERLVTETAACDDSVELAAGLNVLQRIQRLMGQRDASEQTLRRALGLYATLDKPLVTLGMRCDLADFYRLRGATTEAFAILTTALEIAKLGSSNLTAVVHESIADLHAWHHDHANALSCLDSALELATSSGMRVLSARIRLKRAESLTALGGLLEAEMELDALRDESERTGGRLWQAWLLVAGIVGFAKRNFTESHQFLASMSAPFADSTHAPRRLALLCALDLSSHKLEEKSVQNLRQSLLEFGNTEVLQVDAHLTHALLEHLDQGQTPPKDSSVKTNESMPLPVQCLQLDCFGEVKLFYQGKELLMPFAKCTELFVWLAWHNQGNKDTIINALWDGSRESRHHEYFRVAVRRLRQALSDQCKLEFNPIPFERGIYQLHPLITVSDDALSLVKAAQENDWETAWNMVSNGSSVFMASFEGAWLEDIRDQCQALAFEATLKAADRFQNDNPEAARQAMIRALEIEPLSSSVHERLIRLYVQTRDHAAATAAFERYAQVLRREFGSQPPEAFRNWVQSSISQEFPSH
jgi:LuxR family transcriptional regulator, maltose regulon positive regulatory protein